MAENTLSTHTFRAMPSIELGRRYSNCLVGGTVHVIRSNFSDEVHQEIANEVLAASEGQSIHTCISFPAVDSMLTKDRVPELQSLLLTQLAPLLQGASPWFRKFQLRLAERESVPFLYPRAPPDSYAALALRLGLRLLSTVHTDGRIRGRRHCYRESMPKDAWLPHFIAELNNELVDGSLTVDAVNALDIAVSEGLDVDVDVDDEDEEDGEVEHLDTGEGENEGGGGRQLLPVCSCNRASCDDSRHPSGEWQVQNDCFLP